MKYKTFRALMIAAAVSLGGLAVWQCSKEGPEPPAGAQRLAQEGKPNLAASGSQASETYLLATLGKLASEEKLKDVTGGKGSKVNVYNEGGKWARAKVDHDRDEKWDETWFLDGSIIVRQISPNDDGVYSRELRRLGDAWSEDGALAAPSTTTPTTPPTTPTPPTPTTAPTTPTPPTPTTATAPAAGDRPLDAAVLRALEQPVQEKIKDATGSTPYKVNLYSDDKLRWNRLKIDLDRDEKWDEKWTIGADGSIEREVSPADDDRYTEKYARVDGAWVRR